MMRRVFIPIFLAVAALPAMAQDVIVVPLDPASPDEIVADPAISGQDSTGTADGIPLDPINPDDVITLEPLPEGSQGGFIEPDLNPGSVVGQEVTTVIEDDVTQGTGAVLKGLDKFAGSVSDLTLKTGETKQLGWLQVTLGECRYPVDNPSGDAYAWLVIRENNDEVPIFQGWMVASSPALNALDHARFDVWVTHCTTE
ncbi:MAG: DUF2155 domain-containing protein [Maritimibacter sp.]|jgi:hypothetical protein